MGPVTWHCHTVIIIQVCSGGGGQLNDSCQRWWWGAMVVTQQWWLQWQLSLRRKSFVCLLITRLWWGKHHGTYPPVTVRVYPYPHSRVGIYVGSDIPYPDPYPPNPYLCTFRGFQTLADHYLTLNICIRTWRWPDAEGNYSLVHGMANVGQCS